MLTSSRQTKIANHSKSYKLLDDQEMLARTVQDMYKKKNKRKTKESSSGPPLVFVKMIKVNIFMQPALIHHILICTYWAGMP